MLQHPMQHRTLSAVAPSTEPPPSQAPPPEVYGKPLILESPMQGLPLGSGMGSTAASAAAGAWAVNPKAKTSFYNLNIWLQGLPLGSGMGSIMNSD